MLLRLESYWLLWVVCRCPFYLAFHFFLFPLCQAVFIIRDPVLGKGEKVNLV